jgi:hypothetical protein
MAKKYSLTADERETIISWNDSDEGKIFIYSSQRPIVRKLLKNPLFRVRRKYVDKNYRVFPEPLYVEGFLPLRCLTIRTKLVRRKLSDEQRHEYAIRLKNAREPFSPQSVQ